jgi:hypothetical protein
MRRVNLQDPRTDEIAIRTGGTDDLRVRRSSGVDPYLGESHP